MSISIKLKLIQSICISPLLFFFENLFFTVKQLDQIENAIVEHVRNWFKLNQSSTRSFIFSPRSSGGLGIPNPHILYYAKHLAFYLSILNSSDPIAQACARQSLGLHMSKRKATHIGNLPIEEFSRPHFAGYQTDDKGNILKQSKGSWPKSQWQSVSVQCARNNVKLLDLNDYFALEINLGDGISFQFQSPNEFYDMFKSVKLSEYANKLRSLDSQGRVARQRRNVNHSLSSHVFQNIKLRDDIKCFVAKGRLQLLECESLLHTYYPNTYSKACKLCRHPSETVSHILNGCPQFKNMYTERHNRILNIVFDKMSIWTHNVTLIKDTVLRPALFDINNFTRFITQHTRPDITLIDYELKEVKLIEFSVPFDGFIDICYNNKFNKYFPLCQEINALGFKTEIIVLIIGSLGNIHYRFTSGLMKLGSSNSDAKKLSRYLSISAIIGSFIVWKLRCKKHPF